MKKLKTIPMIAIALITLSSNANANCITNVGLDIKNDEIANQLSRSVGAKEIRFELQYIYAISEINEWRPHLVCLTEEGGLYRYTAYRVIHSTECSSEWYSCSSFVTLSNNGKQVLKDDGKYTCTKQTFLSSCD